MTHCGFVALVGRPNVGKSTLLNGLLRQKVSITSRKAQTTRHRILGVKTTGSVQMIFVDTPGLHRETPRRLNEVLNRSGELAARDADVVVMVVEAERWTSHDEHVLSIVKQAGCPAILAINKVDLIRNRSRLLPYIDSIRQKHGWKAIVPISAEAGEQVDALEQEVATSLPESVFLFPEDQVTDRSLRFLAAEMIREKIMRQLGDELPYNIAVEIEQFREHRGVTRINGLILVERAGQKRIVIGQGGSKLKRIGTDARRELERLLDTKVMLELWVKVRSGWSNDARALKSLGYDEP